jgi:cation diffusion facilitator family transporter
MYASLFYAVRESSRYSDRKSFSFGLHRLEVVGVLFAMVFQYTMLAQIVVAALGRLWSPPPPLDARAGPSICLIATFSLCVNSALAMWMSKITNVHSHSHVHGGMASRMARMHLIIDAVQNGIVILTGGILWIDPLLARADTICTLVFAALVIASTQSFFRLLVGIVMEKAPEDLDCEQLFTDLKAIKNVLGVHCFHAWSISQGKVVVSAHLHVKSGAHEDVLQRAKIILKHRYGIKHSTLQVSDDDDLD